MKTLPEKWCVRVGEDPTNNKMFRKWRATVCSSKYGGTLGYLRDDGVWNSKPGDGIVLTLEEFKWWVLGELPKRWYITLTDLSSDQRRIVGEFFNKSCSVGEFSTGCYTLTGWKRLHSHNNSNISILSKGAKGLSFANCSTENSIEISFDEFKKYILKQETPELPKKWCIEVTTETNKILSDWRECVMHKEEVAPIDEFNKYGIEVGDTIRIISFYTVKEVNEKGIRLSGFYSWNEVDRLIQKKSFELIKKPKEEKIPEFVLPDKWYIPITKENHTVLYEWWKQQPNCSTVYWDGTDVSWFKKHVLAKGFVLPEEWYVHANDQGQDTVITAYINNTYKSDLSDYASERGFYYSNLCINSRGNEHYSPNIPSKGTEITFEQFKKYILKSTIMETKKIINYKLVKEYPGSPELGSITDRTMYFPENYPEFWEPVYEEKKSFKVEDWVYAEKQEDDDWRPLLYIPVFQVMEIFNDEYLRPVEGSGSGILAKLCRLATTEEIQKVKKDSLVAEAKRRGFVEGFELSNAETIASDETLISGCGGQINSNFEYNATLDRLLNRNAILYSKGKWAEIKKYPNITIKNYTAKFTKDSVKFGCQEYSKDFVLKLHHMLVNNDFEFVYREEVEKMADWFNSQE